MGDTGWYVVCWRRTDGVVERGFSLVPHVAAQRECRVMRELYPLMDVWIEKIV